MKTKKKTICIIAVVLSAILCFPITSPLKDGGSVSYHSVLLLYRITVVHEFSEPEGYKDGLKIEILGQVIYEKYK